MKFTTIIGLMLLLVVTSVWAGTLTDNFDDGDFEGWRTFGGRVANLLIDQSVQWGVEKGELVGISKNVCTWANFFGVGDDTWKDYEFEFEFRIEKIFPTPVGCGLIGSPLVGFGVHFDNPDEFIVNGLSVVVLEQGGIDGFREVAQVSTESVRFPSMSGTLQKSLSKGISIKCLSIISYFATPHTTFLTEEQ